MQVVPTFINAFLRNKIDIVLVFLLAVVSTFTLVKVNPILIFSLLFTQAFLMFKRKDKNAIKGTTYFWLLITLYAFNIIGLLYTENTSRGLDVITRQIVFILFPIFYSVYRLNKIRLLLIVFVVSIFSFILVFEIDTLYRFYFKSNIFPLNLELFFSTKYTGSELIKALDMHKAYFGMYVMFSNVIIIDFLFKTKKNQVVFLLLFLLIFQSLFLMQMIAKTAIILNILIILSSISYFLIIKRRLKEIIFSGVLIIFLGWFTTRHLDLSIERITDRFIELQDGENALRETRVKLWNASLPIIENNIIFGVGTGDVEGLLHKEYEKVNIKSRSNVHNQYLDYLLKFGVIGLGFFLFILMYALLHAIKTRNYIYFCFTLIIMACCLTENILSRQWGITFYAVFNYLLFTNSIKNK